MLDAADTFFDLLHTHWTFFQRFTQPGPEFVFQERLARAIVFYDSRQIQFSRFVSGKPLVAFGTFPAPTHLPPISGETGVDNAGIRCCTEWAMHKSGLILFVYGKSGTNCLNFLFNVGNQLFVIHVTDDIAHPARQFG